MFYIRTDINHEYSTSYRLKDFQQSLKKRKVSKLFS